jgi:hypothetical protein
VALGEPFQVNTYATGFQTRPQIAALPEGGFVIAWQTAADESSEPSARARRFDASGAALGKNFPLEGVRVPLSIASLEDRLIVAYDEPRGLALGWFDYEGKLRDQRITDEHGRLAVASLATSPLGHVVFAWDTFAPRQEVESGGVGGPDSENERQAGVIVIGHPVIKARRFGSGGSSDSPTFVIDATGNEYPIGPRVAAGPDGSFVVVWWAEDFQQLYARRFDGATMQLQERTLVAPTVNNEGVWDICTLRDSEGFLVISSLGHKFLRLSAEGQPGGVMGCKVLHGGPSSVACLGDGAFAAVGFNRYVPEIRAFNRQNRVIGSALINDIAARALTMAPLSTNKVAVSWHSCISKSATACDVWTQLFELSTDPHCPGDCNLDGRVTVDELVLAVDVALRDPADAKYCSTIDIDSDCLVSIHEVVLATKNALGGCDR